MKRSPSPAKSSRARAATTANISGEACTSRSPRNGAVVSVANTPMLIFATGRTTYACPSASDVPVQAEMKLTGEKLLRRV